MVYSLFWIFLPKCRIWYLPSLKSICYWSAQFISLSSPSWNFSWSSSATTFLAHLESSVNFEMNPSLWCPTPHTCWAASSLVSCRSPWRSPGRQCPPTSLDPPSSKYSSKLVSMLLLRVNPCCDIRRSSCFARRLTILSRRHDSITLQTMHVRLTGL